jgi:hypothetical protein
MAAGNKTAAIQFGLSNCAIRSTKSVSIEEESFVIYSKISNELFFNLRCSLNQLTEYGGLATSISNVLFSTHFSTYCSKPSQKIIFHCQAQFMYNETLATRAKR